MKKATRRFSISIGILIIISSICRGSPPENIHVHLHGTNATSSMHEAGESDYAYNPLKHPRYPIHPKYPPSYSKYPYNPFKHPSYPRHPKYPPPYPKYPSPPFNPRARAQCSCGKIPINAKNRVIGSIETRPHEFPWMVRIQGGCQGGTCGGALISPRLVLSAYHCTWSTAVPPYDGSTPCDHRDERRVAIIGQHDINNFRSNHHNTIPIIDVKYPNHGKHVFRQGDYDTHDFAILVLKYPAKFSKTIQPICLPQQGQEFYGVNAIAAGWGRFAPPQVNTNESPVLRAASVRVARKRYKHYNFLGTYIQKDGKYKDPCSGDSGSPLMYLNQRTLKYVVIGTVRGNGYDCRDGTVANFEKTTFGLWNKVSNWVDFTKGVMRAMGEPVCS